MRTLAICFLIVIVVSVALAGNTMRVKGVDHVAASLEGRTVRLWTTDDSMADSKLIVGHKYVLLSYYDSDWRPIAGFTVDSTYGETAKGRVHMTIN